MRHPLLLVVPAVLLALLASAARAQDAAYVDSRTVISVDGARRAAHRLLTAGVEPLCPGLKPDEVEVDPDEDPYRHVRAGPTRSAGVPGHLVSLTHDGTFAWYERRGGDFSFARDAADEAPAGGWTDEARRAFADRQLDETGAVAEARRFLAACWAPCTARRFVLDGAHRVLEGDQLSWFVAFREVPGPGELTCYPNSPNVYVNPVTRKVFRALTSNVTARVTAPTPIDEAGARANAARLRPGTKVDELRLSMLLRRGEPRPVWRVVVSTGGADQEVLVVDAVTGKGRVPVED